MCDQNSQLPEKTIGTQLRLDWSSELPSVPTTANRTHRRQEMHFLESQNEQEKRKAMFSMFPKWKTLEFSRRILCESWHPRFGWTEGEAALMEVQAPLARDACSCYSEEHLLLFHSLQNVSTLLAPKKTDRGAQPGVSQVRCIPELKCSSFIIPLVPVNKCSQQPDSLSSVAQVLMRNG